MVAAVLVTGATGYIGGRFLRHFEEAGRPLRCLARIPGASRHSIDPGTLSNISGDARSRNVSAIWLCNVLQRRRPSLRRIGVGDHRVGTPEPCQPKGFTSLAGPRGTRVEASDEVPARRLFDLRDATPCSCRSSDRERGQGRCGPPRIPHATLAAELTGPTLRPPLHQGGPSQSRSET
jgi:hypothetical protein